MPAPRRPGLLLAAAALLAPVAFAQAPAAAGADDRLGGGATVRDAGPNAFGFPLPGLTSPERRAFAVGNSFFKQNWVQEGATTTGRDGLGPLFNARSCSACHLHDGRGRPPAPGETEHQGLLLRIGIPVADGADLPHPRYGAQIQDAAVPGVSPEAAVTIDLEPVAGAYADGTPFELLAPRYSLKEPAYGPLGDTVLGPRVAPQLIGLGLLEAIPGPAILARADPDDRDGDGISGRANFIVGPGLAARQLGRFGWKATQPSVRLQTAAAFAHDIGITSSLFPREPLATLAQQALVRAAGAGPEIDDHKLDRVVFYVQALAVPAQRTPGAPAVAAGRRLFDLFGCGSCHVPQSVTGDDACHPALRAQRIQPFTDMLLHDLGPGLADGKRDGEAGPQEWRTPPLWGIGLVPVVNGHSRYLHDGRARDLAEAVLWHGGEALAARERFRSAAAADRQALLAFLGSL